MKKKSLNNSLDYSHKMRMNWDYIAGFFDGEGWVTLYREKKNKWGKAVKIGIAQKDINPLIEIKKFLLKNGLKSISFYTSKTRDISQLQIQNKFDINLFLKKMIPRVIVKKKRCLECQRFVQDKWYKIGIYPEQTKKEARKLYEKGKNYFQISKIIKADHKTIKSWIIEDV